MMFMIIQTTQGNISVIAMNQILIGNSRHRYSNKRNSYEGIKNSFSLKNAKKSLPEVCIDLNQHQRKPKMFNQPKMTRVKEPDISYFDDKRKGKYPKKKDQLVIKNMYETHGVRTQNQNKNVLNEYRDEIEELKMENERLKEQNEKFRINEKYLNHKIKDISQNNYQNEERKQYVIFLERKVDKYTEKIKKLYQELINEKKKNTNSSKRESMTRSTVKDHYEKQNQLYSYRMQHNRQENGCKKLTSPSSEIDRIQWTEEIQPLMIYEKKGQDAYYKARGGYYGTYNSDTS